MTRLTESIPLAEDATIPADMFTPELVLFRDGTRVVMLAQDDERAGVTFGRSESSKPYPLQAVRWQDGTEDHVAPHTLFAAGDRDVILDMLEEWVWSTPAEIVERIRETTQVATPHYVARLLRALARRGQVRRIGTIEDPRYSRRITSPAQEPEKDPETADINDVVLAIVPVERGGATLHQITAMVRGVLPEARLTEVAHALLALRADGKVRKTAGDPPCWARRI